MEHAPGRAGAQGPPPPGGGAASAGGPSGRRRLAAKLAAGLALACLAALLAFGRARPNDLAFQARLDPPAVPAGQMGRLRLVLQPGPGRTVHGAPTAEAAAPEDVAFDRNADYFLHPTEPLEMIFKVDARAAPGRRRLQVRVRAEVSREREGVIRPVELRRQVFLTVTPPGEGRP